MERIDLLGVKISAINMAQALAEIDGWIAHRQPNYICVTPIHTIMDCYDDPKLREIYNHSGLTTPDGMPVVWWLQFHGKKWAERVYGPDLMLALCAHSIKPGYRHYFYGGTPAVLQSLEDNLVGRFEGLQVCGSYSPPFRPLTEEEDLEVIKRINQAAPDILWVGIGSPRQEYWMARHASRVKAPVLIGVGAAFDFLSGRKPQAPLWVRRAGLEWFFRLASEPRRLWRRYLLGYPRFLFLLGLHQAGIIKID